MKNKKRTKKELYESKKVFDQEESLKEACENYHPDMELYVHETNRNHIDYGQLLADRVLLRTGTIENSREWFDDNLKPIKIGNIEKLAEIINKPFSPLGIGESVTLKEYKDRLKELRSEGYVIPSDYWNTDKREIITYFDHHRKVINAQAMLL